MRTDSLQEFVKLRRQLAEEKANIEKRLRQINEALGDISSGPAEVSPAEGQAVQPVRASGRGRGKRRMSDEARARIAEAQRKRWAASRKGQGGNAGAQRKSAQAKANGAAGKRTMSAAGRKAIAEAARRRWAAAKAAGKSRL